MIPLFKVFMDPQAGPNVTTVLNSGYIGEGEKVKQFEQELKKVLGSPTLPVTVNSCTSAITLALHLLDIGPGDEVITTPITCTATNSPILNRGATPVFVDVDDLTGNISPYSVRKAITERTKAIMAVDWSGRACDYEKLRAIAEEHSIAVIQDAAHGPLVFDTGRPTGHIICLSFQAIKHLTTVDGGALIFNMQYPEANTIFESHARLLRWYGLDRESSADFRCSQNIVEAGYKFHMNDVNATIGLANLPHLRSLVEQHRKNAALLDISLSDIPEVTLPKFDPCGQYWVFTIICEDRDGLKRYLERNGIMSSQVHARNDKHKAFGGERALPRVNRFDTDQLSIPCGWWLSQDDLRQIISTIRRFYE